jgi:hypothetical protein
MTERAKSFEKTHNTRASSSPSRFYDWTPVDSTPIKVTFNLMTLTILCLLFALLGFICFTWNPGVSPWLIVLLLLGLLLALPQVLADL